MAADEKTFKPGDTDNNLLRKILMELNDGLDISGGTINIPGNINATVVGGSLTSAGAVTIADGADVTQGSKSDLAVASPLSDPASSISLQRNEISLLGSIATTSSTIQTRIPASLGAKTSAGSFSVTIATDIGTAAAPIGTRLSTGAAFYDAAKTGQLPTTLGQTTVANSLSVAIASDQIAGLNNVGGYTAGLKDTTAVSTSPAYSIGDAVGAKRTITGALRTSNGSGILESITILDRANQKAPMELFIFDSNPGAATITDNAAFVFSTDDLKVIAHVTIAATDYITINSKAIATIKGLGIALRGADSSTSLYAALVTTGTPTYTATSDVQLIYGILQD